MIVAYRDEYVEACLREGVKVFDMDSLYEELTEEEFDTITLKNIEDSVAEYRKEIKEVIKLVNKKKRLPKRLQHLVDNYLGFEGK